MALFEHVYLEKIHDSKHQELIRDDSGPQRFYIDPVDGNRYLSVTSFLGSIGDKTSLDEWKKAVGEESARLTSRLATSKGTAIHRAAELYLNNYCNAESVLKAFPEQFDWKFLRPALDKHVNRIVCQEYQMKSNSLLLAGTVDCIAEIDGVLSIVDFKTSSRIKHRDEIESYFLQCAAYAIMFYELTGIRISQLVIMMVVDASHVEVFKEPAIEWMKRLVAVRNVNNS